MRLLIEAFASFVIAAIAQLTALEVAAWPLRSLNETSHWTDRARLAWPVRIAFGAGPMTLVGVGAAIWYSSVNQPGRTPHIAVLLLTMFVGATWSGSYVLSYAMQRSVRFGEVCKDYLVTYLLLSPMIPVLGTLLILLSHRKIDSVSIVIILGGLVVTLLLALGLGIYVGSILRLIVAAPERLNKVRERFFESSSGSVPQVKLLRWNWCNAIAFTMAQTILFTQGAIDVLDHEELGSIFAHEMAHMNETPRQKLGRLFFALSLLPLGTCPLWYNEYGLMGALVPVLVTFIGARIARRFRREMEVRADHAATQHAAEGGTYARALEKLYRHNVAPAVMPGKHQIHPNLYDRMLAAGLQPDFPRPKPPHTGFGLITGFLFAAIYLFAIGVVIYFLEPSFLQTVF